MKGTISVSPYVRFEPSYILCYILSYITSEKNKLLAEKL